MKPELVMHSEIISLIDGQSKQAGYAGLYTAQKLHHSHDAVRDIVNTWQRVVGREVKHCWGTQLIPGGSVDVHGHNTSTLVYFLHDHPIGLWTPDYHYEAMEGETAYLEAYEEHWVPENDTDETRYTLVMRFRD